MSLVEILLALTVLMDRLKGCIMSRIGTPMKVPKLNLQPPQEGGIELSKDMQQTLALLCGFWQNQRVPITALPSGGMATASPRIKGLERHQTTGDDEDWQGPDIPTTEVMISCIIASPTYIYVRPHVIATPTTGWRMGYSDIWGFSVTNLNQIHVHVPATGGVILIAYTD